MQDEEKLRKFIDRNPEIQLDGFFWRDDVYRVVILGKEKTRSAAVEYFAMTPTALCRRVKARLGVKLGSPRKVRELCNSALRSQPYL